METSSAPLNCLACNGRQNYFFAEKNGCALWKCVACGTIFVYPLPKDTSIFYGEGYFLGGQNGFGYVDYDKDKEVTKPSLKKIVQLAKKFAPDAKTLLDVGAATGTFVEIANNEGWQAEGVEISDYASRVGRSRGFNIITGTLTDVPDTQMYDVVSYLDVLEHIPDPANELGQVKKVLKPDGLLILNLPDASSAVARILGKYWHLITPPEHVILYTPKGLTALLARYGFKIIHKTRVGKRFTIPYILGTLYNWQKLFIWKKLEEKISGTWLTKISIPINLRDNMVIIARKS